MPEVKWIKVATDLFDDEKIVLIESMPDSYAIITVWFKLLCFAGKQNNDGVFTIGNMPINEKMLAYILHMKESVVSVALQTFEQFGMIDRSNGVISITNWNKHQNLDSFEKKKARDRLYQQERRSQQKQIAQKSSDSRLTYDDSSTDSSSYVVVSEEDKEEDKEEDIDIYRDSKEGSCASIVSMFNTICVSYPSVRALTDARRRAIKARLNTYTVDEFRSLFTMAEESSFLKGKNERDWSATFDWLISDKNMAKVLEGNYADRQASSGQKEEPTEKKDEDAEYDDMIARYIPVYKKKEA